MLQTKYGQLFFQSAKSCTIFYFEYIKYIFLLIAYQRPDSCLKVKLSSCLRRDMTIVRDFQGPRTRRDIGIARPRRDRGTQKRVSRHPALMQR